jgi:hypothetical protein
VRIGKKSTESPALTAYKAHVRDQVMRLMTEDKLCNTAVDRPNRELDLGMTVAYDSYTVEIPFNGTLRVYMSGYGVDGARQEAISRLKDGRDTTVSAINVTEIGGSEPSMELPALPEGWDTDPEVVAFKERIRTFADNQVQRGNILRGTVNKRFAVLGIEPLDGPKNYEFVVDVNPTVKAKYTFTVTGKDDVVQAELARLIQADRERGHIDPKRLVIAMPDDIPTPVMTREPIDA